jgi:hypothetical protein
MMTDSGGETRKLSRKRSVDVEEEEESSEKVLNLARNGCEVRLGSLWAGRGNRQASRYQIILDTRRTVRCSM